MQNLKNVWRHFAKFYGRDYSVENKIDLFIGMFHTVDRIASSSLNSFIGSTLHAATEGMQF